MGRPSEHDVNEVLLWALAAKRQLTRYLDYYADDVMVYSPTVPDDAPDGAWSMEEWNAAMMADLHFLLIACAKLVKLAKRVQDAATLDPVADDLDADLRDMRNVWEHWDEHRDAFRGDGTFHLSGASLAERHPDVHPRSLQIGRDMSVGPIPLRRVWEEVDRVEQQIRATRPPRDHPLDG